MSRTTPIPAKPTEITLDTLPQLFAHHRAQFGGWSMTQTPPEPDPPQDPPNDPPAGPTRPDGISDEEWNALGDPGRAAIVREREARQAAERALAASRGARPGPPPRRDQPGGPPPAQPQDQPGGQVGGQGGQSTDIAALVQQAVAAAVQPFVEATQQRDAEQAAERVQQAVLDAAKGRLHDETDALTNLDLASVVDEHGKADPAKVKSALDDLVTRKPHLARSAPGTPRLAPPGIGGGTPVTLTDAEKVKAVLSDMQKATGVRPAAASAAPSAHL